MQVTRFLLGFWLQRHQGAPLKLNLDINVGERNVFLSELQLCTESQSGKKQKDFLETLVLAVNKNKQWAERSSGLPSLWLFLRQGCDGGVTEV